MPEEVDYKKGNSIAVYRDKYNLTEFTDNRAFISSHSNIAMIRE